MGAKDWNQIKRTSLSKVKCKLFSPRPLFRELFRICLASLTAYQKTAFLFLSRLLFMS